MVAVGMLLTLLMTVVEPMVVVPSFSVTVPVGNTVPCMGVMVIVNVTASPNVEGARSACVIVVVVAARVTECVMLFADVLPLRLGSFPATSYLAVTMCVPLLSVVMGKFAL